MKQERNQRKAGQTKTLLEEKSWKKYTLKPKINQWSQQYKRSYKTPLEADLMDTMITRDNRVYEQQIEASRMEVKDVRSVPKISLKSKKISDESMRAGNDGRDGLGNIHDVLYLNSFYRQQEKEKNALAAP